MSTSASTSRASGWEWAQVALLAANLAWTTLCLGGYRPETMGVTSWLTGLFLILILPSLGLLGFRRESGAFARNAARVALLLGAFALVLTVSRGGIIGLALGLTFASLFTSGLSGWLRLGRAIAVFGGVLLTG